MALSGGEIAGVVIGVVVGAALLAVLCYRKYRHLSRQYKYKQYLAEQRNAELEASLEFDNDGGRAEDSRGGVEHRLQKFRKSHAMSERNLAPSGRMKRTESNQSNASDGSHNGSFNNRTKMVRGNSGLEAKASRALRYSVLRGETQLLQEQLKKGFFNVDDILDVKTKGRALHLAASKGRNTVVILLLEKNADASISDQNGQTAADLARAKGFTQLADLIASHARRQQSGQMIASRVQAHIQKADKKLSRTKSMLKQISALSFRRSVKSVFGNGKEPQLPRVESKISGLITVNRSQSSEASQDSRSKDTLGHLMPQRAMSSPPEPETQSLGSTEPKPHNTLEIVTPRTRRRSLPDLQKEGGDLVIEHLDERERRRSLPAERLDQLEVTGVMSALVQQLEQVFKQKGRRRSSQALTPEIIAAARRASGDLRIRGDCSPAPRRSTESNPEGGRRLSTESNPEGLRRLSNEGMRFQQPRRTSAEQVACGRDKRQHMNGVALKGLSAESPRDTFGDCEFELPDPPTRVDHSSPVVKDHSPAQMPVILSPTSPVKGIGGKSPKASVVRLDSPVKAIVNLMDQDLSIGGEGPPGAHTALNTPAPTRFPEAASLMATDDLLGGRLTLSPNPVPQRTLHSGFGSGADAQDLPFRTPVPDEDDLLSARGSFSVLSEKAGSDVEFVADLSAPEQQYDSPSVPELRGLGGKGPRVINPSLSPVSPRSRNRAINQPSSPPAATLRAKTTSALSTPSAGTSPASSPLVRPPDSSPFRF